MIDIKREKFWNAKHAKNREGRKGKFKIQNSKFKSQNSKVRIQKSKFKNQNSKVKSENSKVKNQIPSPSGEG